MVRYLRRKYACVSSVVMCLAALLQYSATRDKTTQDLRNTDVSFQIAIRFFLNTSRMSAMFLHTLILNIFRVNTAKSLFAINKIWRATKEKSVNKNRNIFAIIVSRSSQPKIHYMAIKKGNIQDSVTPVAVENRISGDHHCLTTEKSVTRRQYYPCSNLVLIMKTNSID